MLNYIMDFWLKYLPAKQKTLPEEIVSAFLYGFGLSSRKTNFLGNSHVSVLEWYRRLSQAIGKIQPKHREAI